MPKFEVGILEEHLIYHEVEADTFHEAYEKAAQGDSKVISREYHGLAKEHEYYCERV